jgi:hypothetical protein
MFKITVACLPVLWLPAAVLAQTAQSLPRPDPLDAKAATAPLVYRSALATYKKSASEPPPLAWRQANETVERIGGWRAYAREAQATPTPQPAASGPAARPAAP